jgi:hypothetical protein
MTNEIRWIDRDKDGKINGHFTRKQREGQESLPEDHPELLAFNVASKAAMEAAQTLQAAKESDLLNRLAIAESKLLEFESIKSRLVNLETAAKPVEPIQAE